ncbi:MAG: hypothetical protein M1368_04705 [Thaumarchaeota archaeon]|nr:hypothetical protein [Nitrososphaerota archaeon]
MDELLKSARNAEAEFLYGPRSILREKIERRIASGSGRGTLSNTLEEENFVVEAALLRRNLNTFQRIELAQHLAETEQVRTKTRQKLGVRTLASNDAKVGKTSEIVAKRFGITVATFERGLHILKLPSSDQIAELERGEATINGVYAMLRRNPVALGEIHGEAGKPANDSHDNRNGVDKPSASPDSVEDKRSETKETRQKEKGAIRAKVNCSGCGEELTMEKSEPVLLCGMCRGKLGMRY